jgi:hypothetical protein
MFSADISYDTGRQYLAEAPLPSRSCLLETDWLLVRAKTSG